MHEPVVVIKVRYLWIFEKRTFMSDFKLTDDGSARCSYSQEQKECSRFARFFDKSRLAINLGDEACVSGAQAREKDRKSQQCPLGDGECAFSTEMF